ncbi:hypothetical protein DPMN_054321 [Dreissena polymorpha]|uniref:Uncharacterized protein n=1 Tax=Dreissena polymorpha TaxID=45954 RepID=A0A9D4HPK7_DREPO|nr:hypothetical protein DPMN_054321 [Dreissena polymorpha]
MFHDDWAKNVTSRPNKENCPHTGGHVFKQTGTTFEINQHIIKTNIFKSYMKIGHEIFKLDQGIIGTNRLTKFHEDLTRNVPSRVFTRKTAMPTDSHDIIGINLLTKLHEDRTRNAASRVFTMKSSPPSGGQVFQQTGTTFELNQHIIKTNILTK